MLLNYLQEILQKVKVRGGVSVQRVANGDSQGSILGLLLFLV